MTIKEMLAPGNGGFVKIPIWLVTLIIPVVFVGFSFFIVQAQKQTAIQVQIDVQTQQLELVRSELANKATRAEVERVQLYMVRIDDKLNRLIERRE